MAKNTQKMLQDLYPLFSLEKPEGTVENVPQSLHNSAAVSAKFLETVSGYACVECLDPGKFPQHPDQK